jgi:hypothetical protein
MFVDYADLVFFLKDHAWGKYSDSLSRIVSIFKTVQASRYIKHNLVSCCWSNDELRTNYCHINEKVQIRREKEICTGQALQGSRVFFDLKQNWPVDFLLVLKLEILLPNPTLTIVIDLHQLFQVSR